MKQRACLFIFIFLAACQQSYAAPPATISAPQALLETATPSPVPTLTFTPSATPSIAQLIFPYTIAGLRQHEFQGGEIHIRSTLDETEFYTTYLIDYPSDGLTITGIMQIPAGDGPFPVILMNHGFFNRDIYRSGDGTDRAAAFLARYGYITLSSDYRSWGESDIGHSFFYSGLTTDVINLMNAISSIPEADPNRIGMWGHSMGGGVTMKVLAIDSRIKAAVLYSSVSADDADIINRWGVGCFGDIAAGEKIIGCNSSDVIPDDLPSDVKDAYRFAATDLDTLEKIAPFHHLEDITAPIQIHYGTEDGRILSGTPPEWSRKINQGLLEAGKEVQIFQYDGERHSFIGQAWFDFMGRSLRFFDKYVK